MVLGLTIDGLREMIDDLRRSGVTPAYVLVGPMDARDVTNEVMAHAKEVLPGIRDDKGSIAIIEGIPVLSRADVPRGKAWVIPAQGEAVRIH